MDTLCLVASPVGFSSFEWPCSLHFLSVHYCLCSGKLDEALTSVLSVSESPSRHNYFVTHLDVMFYQISCKLLYKDSEINVPLMSDTIFFIIYFVCFKN